jgi:hypothetical protein
MTNATVDILISRLTALRLSLFNLDTLPPDVQRTRIQTAEKIVDEFAKLIRLERSDEFNAQQTCEAVGRDSHIGSVGSE